MLFKYYYTFLHFEHIANEFFYSAHTLLLVFYNYIIFIIHLNLIIYFTHYVLYANHK